MTSCTSIAIKHFGSASDAFETFTAPVPTPNDDEVLIDVACFGLNYADVLARKGIYPDCPPLPAVIGYEVVGRIAAVGKNVDAKRIGERVVAFTRFGGYATHAVADARVAVPISENIPDDVATALATQYCTAYYAAEEMVVLHQGDFVLIQAAAGGVGTALVQLCKRRGCIVVGTAGSGEKCNYVLQQGADHAINYRTHDFAVEFKKLFRDKSPDVIFDSLGSTAYRKAYNMLGAGGRLVGFGVAELSGTTNKLVRTWKGLFGFGFYHPALFLSKSKSLISVYMLPVADRKPEMLQRCLQNVVALTERGELKPYIDRVFSPGQIAEAHEYLEQRKSKGKVVVKW
jgi:NADPH:quinone reductase-like Zn-dependent oxidoreductase